MKLKNNLIILALFSLVLMSSISIVSAQDFETEDIVTTYEADEITLDETQEEISTGNTIYISPEGTGDGSNEANPTTWNNALSKANNGDTIQFLNGNYTEINNVHQQITKSITLKGSGNSIIDAQEDGGFFTVSAGCNLILQNLTLQKAYTGKHYNGPDGTDAPFNGEGGIINNGELTAIDCYFYYNKGFGTEGGSIRNNGVCIIYNSTFDSNSGKSGASIYCEKNSRLTVYNSEFKKGFSKKGNDIYADENAVVSIYNCKMGNAYGKCGLIVIKKSYLYIYDTYISGSRSIDTAGVINIDKESTVEIYRCTFEKNTATGGVLLFNEKNEPGDGDGGAIVVEKGANNVIIKDSIFKGNTAKNRGGAIYIESDTSITIDNCTFEGNTAGLGDNIYCYKYANRLTILNSKFEIKSTIETTDIDYGQVETVKVTLDDGTYGLLNPTYSLILDGAKSYSVSNGASITLSDLSVGNHSIVLTANDYNSNEYIFTQNSSIFIVGGSEEIEVTVSYSFNDDGSMNVQVIDEYNRPVSNREVTVTINNTPYTAVTGSDGVAKIAPTLDAGEYNISVEVPGKTVSNSTPAKINVTNKTDVPISDEVDVRFSYNDDGSVNVEVKDKYNRVIPDTEVRLTINGITYAATTNSQGIARITPDKNVAGEYDVKVEVAGKTVSAASQSTIKVMPSEKTSSIQADDIKRAVGSAYDFRARLLDRNANPLKNKAVNFVINGNDYEVKTDEYGYAYLRNTLTAGVYTIIVENPATGETLNRTATIVARITGNKNINIDYTYTGTYKVRVYADNGQVVGAGENVVITLNGKANNVLTDAKGYAAFKVANLLPKTYTITAEYKGVKVSNSIVVKQVLKASNKKYKRYRLKTYSATLKTSSGKAINGKTLKFKFNGKTYKAKTNSKGVAKITIKKFWKVGKHKITISYLKTSITKTITVKR